MLLLATRRNIWQPSEAIESTSSKKKKKCISDWDQADWNFLAAVREVGAIAAARCVLHKLVLGGGSQLDLPQDTLHYIKRKGDAGWYK